MNLQTFFRQQLDKWPMARDNYRNLETVKIRKIDFGRFIIEAQYNPSRIRSAAVDIDKQALASRPCPLCRENHPQEQDIMPFDERFSIAVNPYPVFEPHFTILCNTHTPQVIKGNLATMFNLAEQFPDYSILYNGAECGASVPDHLHFQAISKGLLPVEKEWDRVGEISLRTCYVIENEDKEAIEHVFNERFLATDPMINLLCLYDTKWKLFVFPRKQHRPSQYYARGKEHILTSPGIIDMAGVFVFPRKEDYNKINKELLTDIYTQVSL